MPSPYLILPIEDAPCAVPEADEEVDPGVLPVLFRAAVGSLISWNDVLSGPTISLADVYTSKLGVIVAEDDTPLVLEIVTDNRLFVPVLELDVD